MTRQLLIALHATIGGLAIAAGGAFVRDPSGKPLGMTTEWLERSPFPDFRVPGLLLGVVVGGTNLISAMQLWRRDPLAALASFATGALLVVWIAIQTAIIGCRHWSQLFWWTTFVLVAALTARNWRATRGRRDG